MSETLITLTDVSVHYGKRVALQKISGTFSRGALIALAGPNGSGKSTLLKTVAGVIRPSSGRVSFADDKRPVMAYLPQVAHMQRDFPVSVGEAVLTGFYPVLGEIGAVRDEHRSAMRAALDDVGLHGYEKRPISDLSGGEFQRMLFARVIVQNAPVILLDEPFTAVDAETTARLIRLLLKWHAEGRTVVCVLHDLLLIKKYFPESMVLQGKCLGMGHTHQMFEQKLLSFDLDMAELHPTESTTTDKSETPAHHDHHGHTCSGENHHEH